MVQDLVHVRVSELHKLQNKKFGNQVSSIKFGNQVSSLASRETERQAGRDTGKLAKRQAGRHKGREAEMQEVRD